METDTTEHSAGGLGIRNPVSHAAGAYLASLRERRDLCVKLDSDFDYQDALGGSYTKIAMDLASASMGGRSNFDFLEDKYKQKTISERVDAGEMRKLRESEAGDLPYLAHLALHSVKGAGVWLTAPAADEPRRIKGETHFQIMLKRKLRIPVYKDEVACPECGQIMDAYGDHAVACMAGGDRTRRHNRIRNALYEDLVLTRQEIRKEVKGLLPLRPKKERDNQDDGYDEREDETVNVEGVDSPSDAQARRPADVFSKDFNRKGAAAFDLAVTSGLNAVELEKTVSNPSTALLHYERFKRLYKPDGEQFGTEALCSSNNIWSHALWKLMLAGLGPLS